jgi:hypothetical protein
MAAFARPVRMAVNSSLVTSMDFAIFVSASFRMLGMSSLTGMLLDRVGVGAGCAHPFSHLSGFSRR